MRISSVLSFAAVAMALQVSGCASTNFELSGSPPKSSACQAEGHKVTALILWGPIWRPNQKDVPLREAAALQGIEDFANNSGCFSNVVVQRLPGGRLARVPSAEQIHATTMATSAATDRVVVLTVRELGPVLQIGGPIAKFGGGTEVVLEAQIHEVNSASAPEQRGVHWSNGGSFVIKGTKTLPKDMRSALDALFGRLRSDG